RHTRFSRDWSSDVCSSDLAAVQRLLTEVVAEDDRMALFPPADDGVPSSPEDVWQDRGHAVTPPDPQRRRKMTIALTSLGAAVLRSEERRGGKECRSRCSAL